MHNQVFSKISLPNDIKQHITLFFSLKECELMQLSINYRHYFKHNISEIPRVMSSVCYIKNVSIELIKYAHIELGLKIDLDSIHNVCSAGRFDLVKYVYEHSHHIPSQITRIICIIKGYVDILKYLDKRHRFDYYCDCYLIERAAANGHLNILEYLCDYHNGSRMITKRAIQYAIEGGYRDVVNFLRAREQGR